MSQPYPVPIPLPQSKSRPLPDSRGIPDTFNLFLFAKPIGPDKSHSTSAIGGCYCVHDCDIDCISRNFISRVEFSFFLYNTMFQK